MWRDLKSGDAGWLPRVGLSFAAAGAISAVTFFMIGVFDDLISIRDRYITIAIGVGGAVWCVTLMFIWATFHRRWKVLKTIFSIMGIWSIAIPATVFIDEVMGSADFYISSILALATGATVFVLFTLGYRRGGGKALALRDGVIDVHCPVCEYSLVGLSQCVCPECGSEFTIDEIIRKQNYRVITQRRPALPAGEEEEEVQAQTQANDDDCPVPALPAQEMGL